MRIMSMKYFIVQIHNEAYSHYLKKTPMHGKELKRYLGN